MKNAFALLLLAAVTFVGVSCKRGGSADTGSLTPVTASRYQPGQVWTFHTPPDQLAAYLTVLKVEAEPKVGTIVHVALAGLHLPKGGTTVQHMPFTEAAMDKSVVSLLREGDKLPDFQAGYQQWLEAHLSGRGGVFDITVAEGFETVRTTLLKPAN